MQSYNLLRNRCYKVRFFNTLMGFFGFWFLVYRFFVECVVILVSRHGALFDRQSAIKLSGMSEKAYNRSFNLLQNGLGVKWVFLFVVYLVSFIVML